MKKLAGEGGKAIGAMGAGAGSILVNPGLLTGLGIGGFGVGMGYAIHKGNEMQSDMMRRTIQNFSDKDLDSYKDSLVANCDLQGYLLLNSAINERENQGTKTTILKNPDKTDIFEKKQSGGESGSKKTEIKTQVVTGGPMLPNPDDGNDKGKWKSSDEKKFRLDSSSATDKKILDNLDTKVENFISKDRKGGILREFPGEYLNKSVREVLQDVKIGAPGADKAKKLLIDRRFLK